MLQKGFYATPTCFLRSPFFFGLCDEENKKALLVFIYAKTKIQVNGTLFVVTVPCWPYDKSKTLSRNMTSAGDLGGVTISFSLYQGRSQPHHSPGYARVPLSPCTFYTFF